MPPRYQRRPSTQRAGLSLWKIDQKNAIGDWKLPMQILCVFLGCVTIYASLFSVGNFVYGNTTWGFILIAFAVVSVFALFKCFGKIGVESED